jgi:hypothetical protein
MHIFSILLDIRLGLEEPSSNMLLLSTLFLTVSMLFANGGLAQVAGTHTDLPRWCGKAYEAGYVHLNFEINFKHKQRGF